MTYAIEARRVAGVRFVILVSLLSVALSGCAGTARVSEFESFAKAGIAYTNTVPPLVDESFSVTVSFDSMLLLRTRQALRTQDERLKELDQNNQDLRERLGYLNDIKRHAATLESYFIAIQSFATSNAPAETGSAATGFVTALSGLNERVKNARIGSQSVGEFVGKLVPVIVAQYQNVALNRFIRDSESEVREALEIQRAAIQALGQSMQADLLDQAQIRDFEQITKPYVDTSKPVPPDWADRRKTVFVRDLQISQLSAAQSAAENLKIAFDELLEQRLTQSRLTALMKDIQGTLTIVESLQGKGSTN